MFKLLKKKLKMRLTFWIVFDVTMAMLVVSIININTSYRNTLSLAGRGYENMAKEIAVFVDRKISAIQTGLPIIAQMNELGNQAVSLDRRLETARMAGRVFGENVNIRMTDTRGMELVLSSESSADLSRESYIIDALSGKNHVTAPFYDSAAGRMSMIIAQPLNWNGQITGAIFAQVPESFINETIANVDTGHSGYACIFDSNGVIIAHRDIVGIVRSGQSSYADLAASDASYQGMADAVSTMISEISGTITYTNNDKEKILGGYSSTQNGWIVLVRDTVSEINSDASAAISGSIIGAVICLTLIISIAPRVMGKITAPINFISRILNQLGVNGDFTLYPDDRKELSGYTAKIDEIGICAKALDGHIKHLLNVEHALQQMALGDLTIHVQPLSDKDNIANALITTLNSLNELFSEVQQSASVVSNGSGQIANSSGVLAQGASEQSAATEQLSSAITEITQRTGESTTLTDQAMRLSETIRTNAEKGSRQMDQMIAAVKEINEAGQSISKVIKVIDDIAFQTNILALNAAVEAARAGQHGKGFAVVAEEVRSLASKSSEAAKDTGGLIANSVEKAELGVQIAKETAESLAGIVDGINESDRLISSIAQSTGEQSNALSEINRSSGHISQVAQETSAAAEQSAAAAQEMNGQAVMLENCVRHFKLRNNSSIAENNLDALPEHSSLFLS